MLFVISLKIFVVYNDLNFDVPNKIILLTLFDKFYVIAKNRTRVYALKRQSLMLFKLMKVWKEPQTQLR